jgi:DNA-directed RNA polymerase subunit E'/Rpb7
MAEVVKDTEGTTVDNYYVICILDDYQFSEGRALPGSGHVEYVATYRALCWKPFKNEVVCSAERGFAMATKNNSRLMVSLATS